MDALAEALKSNATLQILLLQHSRIGDAGAQVLAEALKSNVTLQRLGLWKTQIGNAGAQALAEALQGNATLHGIAFSQNRIGDAGAQALAKALEINATLQILDLAGNRIRDPGAQALAKALTSNTTLQTLHLWYNRVGNAGAQALAKALERNVALLYFDGDGHPESLQLLTARNQSLAKTCSVKKLLRRSLDIATAMRSVQIPIYVLLDIVEWESALRMAKIELECTGKRFININCHRRRCELLNRQKRAQMIEFICQKTLSCNQ